MSSHSKKVIMGMLEDIKKHKGRDRDYLMQIYVEKRLNKQVDVYYKQLMSSSETLSHLSERRVVKHLVK